MKKCLSLAFILLISAAAAQNLNIVKIAKYQPLIYRDATGKYEGCGIRTTFLTSIPEISLSLSLKKGMEE